MSLIFIFGMIIYGLARATQQASIFMERNNEPRWAFLANPNQIHFYGWFEPIGLTMSMICLSSLIYANKAIISLVILVLGYFVYWMPYALLYCYLRRKDWFSYNQMYEVGWIKTYLLNKPISIVLFWLASVAIVILWGIYE